jgi:hypothetical protein
VLGKAFFVLKVKVKKILVQGNWRNCANKMLVKLTPNVNVLAELFWCLYLKQKFKIPTDQQIPYNLESDLKF